ncbi:flagellar hook-associated protein FlgK [Paenibacillus sp. MMS18-CY102]|uniref:flagellar hook-associated protein FlgK n=1 Tax=Paenibacillus sp. MMS18-CY102 TaxID=2682849 RepID=UPI001365F9E9|nr:flagellar hook-associated protein FlgK [Paenibacillus sp. MMS18-CY102]MWC30920.1 flagellar hook-associated protein FlgK [Paenibacillus sp. MMS18-CY102]
MRSTFHSIETAKRSLFTEQANISTTGHNIANANTPGFSRQRVNLVASRPIEAPGYMRSNIPGQLGTGVEFTSITRVREKFLDDQFRNANRSLGEWSIQSDTLSKLETVFNEPSDSGIRTVMDNFWKSWTDLGKDPESITGRKIVRENALALVDAFNETSKHLTDLDNDLTTNIATKTAQINSISNSVADLNLEIKRLEAYGDNPNDLMDERDYLVDQLSKMVNVSVVNTADGYDISVGSIMLVDGLNAPGTTVQALETQFNSGGVVGGEIQGLLVSRDQILKDYESQLDAMADTFVNGEITITIPAGSTFNGSQLAADLTTTVRGINGLHNLGYLFTNPPRQADDIFVTSDGTPTITAANIRLSQDIVDDPMNIATSLRTAITNGVNETVKGNNTLANLMAGLKETPFKFSPIASQNGITAGTIDEFYASMIGQLGLQSQEADRQATNQQDIVTQVDSRRQSVSGVSLDEEMSELIKFQHAYSAAARFMTTIDETLDKVINGMGIVGR